MINGPIACLCNSAPGQRDANVYIRGGDAVDIVVVVHENIKRSGA